MSLCPNCDNTGSLSKQLTGQLDCATCDIADKRVVLAQQLGRIAPRRDDVRDWAAYQLGRLEGFDEAKRQS